MVISDFLYKDNRDRNLNSSDRKLVTKSERTAGMVFHMWRTDWPGVDGAKDGRG